MIVATGVDRMGRAGFLGLIGIALCLLAAYSFLSLKIRRRKPIFPGPVWLSRPDAVTDPFVVYLIPCLNEQRVIGRTVEHLLRTQAESAYTAMVIDDGSDDDTAAVVNSVVSDRVRLFQRSLPNARRGKGAALNDAYAYLCSPEGCRSVLGNRTPNQVIVAVLDADGRLQPGATALVVRNFLNPEIGAVQIGVRIGNASKSPLARFQDVEFVVFTEIFQQARRRIGTVGLGGNGQYVRLAALQSLGPEPWSDCLTEDLELGVRLRLNGWVGDYIGETWVEQQGVTSLRKLLRQRTRWFQGHLQCLKLVRPILRSNLGFAAMTDLCWHLASPIVILLMSITTVPFFLSLLVAVGASGRGLPAAIVQHPWQLSLFYLVSFLPSYIYAAVYRSKTPGYSRRAAVLIAHGFIGYGFLWIISGWRAVVRLFRGRSSWSKTERSIEAPISAEHPRAAA
jgi:1,2-diacylglycerol 3-beta-glucosyltransferase